MKVSGIQYQSFTEAFINHPWMLVFLIHPTIGLFLIWTFLATVFNITRVTLEPFSIVVSHGPIPFRKSIRIARSKIKQFFIEEKVRKSKNNVHYVYRVMTQMKDSSKNQIVDEGLYNYKDARVLEQWLERKLNIQDGPVVKEVGSTKVS